MIITAYYYKNTNQGSAAARKSHVSLSEIVKLKLNFWLTSGFESEACPDTNFSLPIATFSTTFIYFLLLYLHNYLEVLFYGSKCTLLIYAWLANSKILNLYV